MKNYIVPGTLSITLPMGPISYNCIIIRTFTFRNESILDIFSHKPHNEKLPKATSKYGRLFFFIEILKWPRYVGYLESITSWLHAQPVSAFSAFFLFLLKNTKNLGVSHFTGQRPWLDRWNVFLTGWYIRLFVFIKCKRPFKCER